VSPQPHATPRCHSRLVAVLRLARRMESYIQIPMQKPQTRAATHVDAAVPGCKQAQRRSLCPDLRGRLLYCIISGRRIIVAVLQPLQTRA